MRRKIRRRRRNADADIRKLERAATRSQPAYDDIIRYWKACLRAGIFPKPNRDTTSSVARHRTWGVASFAGEEEKNFWVTLSEGNFQTYRGSDRVVRARQRAGEPPDNFRYMISYPRWQLVSEGLVPYYTNDFALAEMIVKMYIENVMLRTKDTGRDT